MILEIWKEIKGYEGLYQVSNLGRVKSLERTVKRRGGTTRTVKESIRTLALHKNGYMAVALSKDGKKTTILVHRLVAIAFIPNPVNKKTINHIDGTKNNNVAENLEWSTHKENLRHAVKTGLKPASNPNKNGNAQGENHGSSILNEEKVLFIRKNSIKNGGTKKNVELAQIVGISPAAVRDVLVFRTWKHVGNEIVVEL